MQQVSKGTSKGTSSSKVLQTGQGDRIVAAAEPLVDHNSLSARVRAWLPVEAVTHASKPWRGQSKSGDGNDDYWRQGAGARATAGGEFGTADQQNLARERILKRDLSDSNRKGASASAAAKAGDTDAKKRLERRDLSNSNRNGALAVVAAEAGNQDAKKRLEHRDLYESIRQGAGAVVAAKAGNQDAKKRLAKRYLYESNRNREAAAARRKIEEALLEKSLGTVRSTVPEFWSPVEEMLKAFGGSVTLNRDETRTINLPEGVVIHAALCPADLDPALWESMGPLGNYAWSRLRPVRGLTRARLPEVLQENPAAFAFRHIGGIVRFDARDVEAELQEASIGLHEVQRGFSKVGAGGGYNKNVPLNSEAFLSLFPTANAMD